MPPIIREREGAGKVIRPATLEDMPEIGKLLVSRGLYDEAPSEISRTTLVSVKSGQIAGVIQCLLGHPVSVMTDLAVVEGYEHNGIARSLLGAMEDLMRMAGYRKWAAFTRPDNPRATINLAKYGAKYTGPVRSFSKEL